MKQYKLSKLILFVCLSCLFIMQACKKEDLPSIEPALALPLINGSFTLKDILPEADSGAITTNTDLSLKIVYHKDLKQKTAEEVIIIPNQDVPESFYGIPGFDLIPAGQAFNFTFTDSIPLTFNNNERMDIIEFKEGNFNVTLNSDYKDSVEVTITFPNLKKASIAYSQTYNLNYTGQITPLIANSQTNLKDYAMDIKNNKVEYIVTVKGRKSSNIPGVADNIGFNFDMLNMKFSYLEGYLGIIQFPIPTDTVPLNALQNSFGGSITLKGPTINMNITNSFGLPMNMDLNKFEGVFKEKPNEKIATINKDLFYPADRTDTDKLTNIVLDPSNSNLTAVIQNSPSHLIYGATVKGNPQGTIQKNFVKDSSLISISMDTELPIDCKISGFGMRDTFPGFKIPLEKEEISSLVFVLTLANSFPMDIGVQLIFTDENYLGLDSLLVPLETMIGAGIPSVTGGKVVTPTSKSRDILFTLDRVNKIMEVSHIIMRGVFDSYTDSNNNQPFVKFYSDYTLDVRLGMIVQRKVKF